MQLNGSPPKKLQLGGSIKATSLTHKHNKILSNLKSLQLNNIVKDNNQNKDKEPLINNYSLLSPIKTTTVATTTTPTSCNIHKIDNINTELKPLLESIESKSSLLQLSSSPSSSSLPVVVQQSISSIPSEKIEEKIIATTTIATRTPSAEEETEILSSSNKKISAINLTTPPLVFSSSSTSSSTLLSSINPSTSSLIQTDTSNLFESQQKQQQQQEDEEEIKKIITEQSLVTTNSNNNNLLKTNGISSSPSTQTKTTTTIIKDNINNINDINNGINNNSTNTSIGNYISNYNKINGNNCSTSYTQFLNKYHLNHYRDQEPITTNSTDTTSNYYPYSYSRNSASTTTLVGGGGGCNTSNSSSIGSTGSCSNSSFGSINNLIQQTSHQQQPQQSFVSSTSTSSLASYNNSYHHYHHHQHHHLYNSSSIGSGSSGSSSSGGTGSSNNIMGSTTKRHLRKHAWGTRERAGMSFLIVIAFFAVFGLIILTELFMIDDKNRGGIVMLRHGNINNRMIDSVQPDYDNPKYGDDYENSFGFLPRPKTNDEDPLRLKTNRLSWNELLDTKLEQTLPHYPVGEKPTDGIWKVVNGTRFKFFVYSAYYDKRITHIVRIIGATKTRRPEKVFCRLWYMVKDPSNSNRTKYTSATLIAKVKIIREHWNLKYSAVFVLCPIPPQDIPFAISVVSRLRAPPGNILQLRNTIYDPDFHNRTLHQIPDKMAICVKPFHFNYDQALYLMEYLELNALLGVSHFTFYNHTIGPHATCVLQHYASGDIPHGNLTTHDYFDMNGIRGVGSSSAYGSNNLLDDNDNDNIQLLKNETITQNSINVGSSADDTTQITKKEKKTKKKNLKILKSKNYQIPTVQILPWDLRMRSQMEIRTEGLFAALNDCLYRNMYRYKYLALVDVDEFLMPRHNDTLKDLLSWLNRKYNIAQVGSYSFQNAFYYLQFADDSRLYETPSKNSALRGALVTQRKTRRRLRLHPQKQRSKYIVAPEAVVEAGNHFVWDFIPGKKTFNVPADTGILHHYRVCEFGGDDCVKVPSLLDRTAIKYTNRLIERVEKVYNYLKKPCKLDNLPPAPTRPPPTRRKVLIIRNNTVTAAPAKTTTVTTSKKHIFNNINNKNKNINPNFIKFGT